MAWSRTRPLTGLTSPAFLLPIFLLLLLAFTPSSEATLILSNASTSNFSSFGLAQEWFDGSKALLGDVTGILVDSAVFSSAPNASFVDTVVLITGPNGLFIDLLPTIMKAQEQGAAAVILQDPTVGSSTLKIVFGGAWRRQDVYIPPPAFEDAPIAISLIVCCEFYLRSLIFLCHQLILHCGHIIRASTLNSASMRVIQARTLNSASMSDILSLLMCLRRFSSVSTFLFSLINRTIH